MNDIERELKKNEKLRDMIAKNLERDKNNFAKEIRNGRGEEIITEIKQTKQKNKISFWEKFKRMFI
jgi:hypothetical protein